MCELGLNTLKKVYTNASAINIDERTTLNKSSRMEITSVLYAARALALGKERDMET